MDLIIHHGNCPDGFCAAFVAKKKYPEAQLLGRDYGLPIPLEEVKGKDVLVVDFSWRTREDNDALHAAAKSFRILDHHKTAQATLEGASYATFDMNRSGAGLAWDYLFGANCPLGETYQPRPWYVDYVEDRDLWRHALPHSKEINAFIMTLPHTVDAWGELDLITPQRAQVAGEGALRQVNHYVEKAVAQRQHGVLCGHSIALVNAQYMNISEVGHELTKFADIGAGYFERGDGMMQFSLRSNGDLDVSAIAKDFGGGGHKNAAGFQVHVAIGRLIVDNILGREFQVVKVEPEKAGAVA